jgi:hypothetical protein
MLYLLGDEGVPLAACDDVVNLLAVLLLSETPHNDWECVARFLLCTLHPGTYQAHMSAMRTHVTASESLGMAPGRMLGRLTSFGADAKSFLVLFREFRRQLFEGYACPFPQTPRLATARWSGRWPNPTPSDVWNRVLF